MIVSVFIDHLSAATDRIYDYLVPKEMKEDVKIGKRVIVPFGMHNKKNNALIVDIIYKSDYEEEKLKYINNIVDEEVVVPKYLIELAKHIRDEFFCTYAESMHLILPSTEKLNKKTYYEINKKQDEIKDELILSLLYLVEKRKGKATKEYLESKLEVEKDSLKKILDKLVKEEILKTNVVFKLKNSVDITEEEALENKDFILGKLTPTLSQKKALEEYRKKINEGFNKFLLFGVTGSGKTQVYMQMFEEVLALGKQCLFLVPEIALTPQMTKSLYKYFGEEASVIHSRLTTSQKRLEWERIKEGKAKIVLGARSAIFMPFKDLGLIVIDEEHENSYKSSSSPRYDTINLANFIADTLNIKLVLGSATPSMESFYKAQIGEYSLLKIDKRANDKAFPKVHMVDMRQELYTGNRLPISMGLKRQMEEAFENKEQVILFLNRRGFSTYVFCRACGYIEKCPNCDVSLTYHLGKENMQCHYCGYTKKVPEICPECKSKKIKFMGSGTQKIEKFVKELFPNIRISRLDSDTTRIKGNFERIIEEFSSGRSDVLIGTQMVVKGLDFSNVTLVGILLADATLTFPDINANQRTFQLCTQAAGRAGRGAKEGKVIMQTYDTNNKTLVYAAMQEYESFYSYEIEHRKKMGYPPFSEILGIFCANENEGIANFEMNKIYDIISKKCEGLNLEDITFYPVAPAFIYKLKGKFMVHILIKYPINHEIKGIIREEFSEIKKDIKSNLFVEINPITLL